ncbi:MAG TPA: dihydroxyacetone kinase subunit L [Firmicutes bacterium]|nr:dihydroxyacetone kinase subunit L [Bacillota bacterium]
MEETRDWLGELDGAMGDGDLGLTMSTGFRKAAEALRDLDEKDVGKLLAKAGMVIGQSAPSTMGTLMATGFMKGGKAVQGKEEVQLADLAALVHAFVEGIMARGKAKPGEKTIIDSLHPAAQALDQAISEGRSLKEGLAAAYEAAEKGVEATKAMISQHGRPAYYQEKTLGKQDPGATVGMLVLKGFVDYMS